jgi:hypothetical protein
MLFLFRPIGSFEAAEQLGTKRFAIKVSPVAENFNHYLTQRLLLGGKRGFFKVLCDRCCGICDVTFCCMFRSCKIL